MTSRGVATAGTITALVGLVACGSAPAGAGQPSVTGIASAPGPATPANASANVPLCTDARTVDRVVVRLTVSQPREILPRTMTITDAPRVQALASALCALPRMPRGLHCPAARPGALRVQFAARSRSYQPILIRDSGCASVTGAGPARQWAWSSRPGHLLSEAAGGKGRLVAGTHPSSVPTP